MSATHANLSHVVPLKVLVGVFAALMLFTFLTVAATWVDLGQFNIVIALVIAVIKAVLVGLFFMHLRYDSPFYGVIFVIALAFVALFMGMALLDSTGYQAAIQAAQKPLTP